MTQGKEIVANNEPSNDGKVDGRARRLANLKPFPPGQSGNPAGRAPMPPLIRAALEAGSELAAKRLVALVSSEDERIALLAAQALLDRLYGKAAQAVDKTITTTTVQAQHLSILMELQAKRDMAMKAFEVIEGHTDKVPQYDPSKCND